MAISYLLYVSLLAVSWLFAGLAERKEDKRFVWVIILLLTLIAGFRHYTVGIDTSNYLLKFDLISYGLSDFAYGLERSFRAMCYGILKLFPSNTVILVLMAFITNFCIFTRLWEMRKAVSFSTATLCYYMAFFFLTMNVMRQFTAIGILFFGSRYLVKHQTLRYLLAVFVATLFHQSALLAVSLLAFDVLRWKELPHIHRLVYLGAACCSPLLIWFVLQRLDRYIKYLSEIKVDFGFMVPLKIAVFGFALLFVFCLYGKHRHFPQWDALSLAEKNTVYLTCLCYTIGLCLMFGSYFIPVLNRVSWYFSIFECVFWGVMTKTNNTLHRYAFLLCAIAIVGLGFVTAMTGNAQGTMPYLFFWQ